jgi:hypothetical protein
MRKKRPLRHQKESSMAPMQQHREAKGIEKQLQLDARKQALKRWDEEGAQPDKRKAKPGLP